ncbi:hypothetical protein ZHAS_00019333 [Anopheles sinensis]|uniref:Uncharacterized protein n=1 Tax=Anopheles sinensis TaxID=74873 RepID=A0A084WM39_ANOSI|nr:hypothetical protein ZHAS_00019333 [Anopheles sinensis]
MDTVRGMLSSAQQGRHRVRAFFPLFASLKFTSKYATGIKVNRSTPPKDKERFAWAETEDDCGLLDVESVHSQSRDRQGCAEMVRRQ